MYPLQIRYFSKGNSGEICVTVLYPYGVLFVMSTVNVLDIFIVLIRLGRGIRAHGYMTGTEYLHLISRIFSYKCNGYTGTHLLSNLTFPYNAVPVVPVVPVAKKVFL